MKNKKKYLQLTYISQTFLLSLHPESKDIFFIN